MPAKNHRSRDLIFCRIVTEMPTDVDKLKMLAIDACVHVNTLYNWAWGETMNPHIETLVKVANAMGFDIILAKAKGKVVRFKRK